MDILFNPANADASTFVTRLLIIITATAGIGIITSFTNLKTDFIVLAPMVFFLLNFAWDFLSIVGIVSSYNVYIAMMIFSPFLIVYVLTVIEWWRGITT